ncbi:MAG TPA: hypothetical protein VKM00_07965 [Luteimonas sp.]|nr:hypothetical protein [Luteimonas sp.]
MNDANGYAVFFFPQALEALGEAIKPYLQDSPAGPHVLCNAIDTGGSLIEMTIRGNTDEGKLVVLELMVPVSMVLMIVSTQNDGSFGFAPRLVMDPLGAPPSAGPVLAPAKSPPPAIQDHASSAATDAIRAGVSPTGEDRGPEG